MLDEDKIREKYEALKNDLENAEYSMDMLTKYFKMGAKTFAEYVLEEGKK